MLYEVITISNGNITGGASLRIEANADNLAEAYAEASGGGLVAANGHLDLSMGDTLLAKYKARQYVSDTRQGSYNFV